MVIPQQRSSEAQIIRVLDHLQQHKKIEPLHAWRKLGVYRLAAVIHVLRERGWPIKTSRQNAVNKFGEMCPFALYTLEDK